MTGGSAIATVDTITTTGGINAWNATDSTGIPVTLTAQTGSGTGATATASTTGDELTGITITDGGSGYAVGDIIDVAEDLQLGRGTFRVASVA